MMYRCKICGGSSEPRQSLLRIFEYREVKGHGGARRKEIAGETPVCAACYERLALTPTLEEVDPEPEPKFENKLKIDPALLKLDTEKPLDLDEVKAQIEA